MIKRPAEGRCYGPVMHLSKRKCTEPPRDTLLKVPSELLDAIVRNLSRKDIINVSTLSHAHRALVHGYLFDEVRSPWTNLSGLVKGFKHMAHVRKLSIDSAEDITATTKCEWNASFRPLLEQMPRLEELHIQLATSARCLKYKDDIDEDLTSKIKTLSLRSMALASSGDANGEAMFELSQLPRFHDVEHLQLTGFSLNRDIYFLPRIKEDLSDAKFRKRDGKLNKLDNIELVNCLWEYPVTLKETFAPEYPLPSGIKPSPNCSPTRISLTYTNEASKFVESERFKMFVNNDQNPNFQFEVDFLHNLRDLELVVRNDNYEQNKFRYYYPRLNVLNLKRTFYTEDGGSQCLLGNLRRLRLVGWHLLSGLELDRCFKLESLPHNLEHFELQIVSRGDPPETEAALAESYAAKLGEIFHNNCTVVVGFLH